MPAPEGTNEIVAAILAVARIERHGITGGRSSQEAFVEEYKRMLDAVKKADQP
jgi:hypothetical protein